MKPPSITQIQKEPADLSQLMDSYNRLFQGWMGTHRNIEQALRMLDLLGVRRGQSLMDIGCGTGYVLKLAEERGLQSFGIDISTVALQQARKELDPPPNVIMAAAESIPFPSNFVDFVMILGSLEHFLKPEIAIKETRRILKSDGKAAILVPNSHHIRAIYNVMKYGEILSDLQDFERFATRREWERLFTNNGLNVMSVHKYDTGFARLHKKGRGLFWYLYNILFRLFGNSWIPLNLTYTFIFICSPQKDS